VVEGRVPKARAQARTAVLLAKLHPHWRSYLATGINPVQRAWHRATGSVARAQRRTDLLTAEPQERPMTDAELRVARSLASTAYFDEIEKVLRGRA
jgi:hypothetical protein